MSFNHAILELELADEAATARLGASLARCLEPGMRIYLSGHLGSGKTTLVRALLSALGHTGRVKSPSYALVEAYVISSLYLYHFDFYRFHSPQEWTDAGFDELFDSGAVCLVEWPENAAALLPEPDLAIALAIAAAGRRAVIEARSGTGAKCVSALSSQSASS
jgi:tRNA threonylcarbamoyladenosine biosynthesis protein TsaE